MEHGGPACCQPGHTDAADTTLGIVSTTERKVLYFINGCFSSGVEESALKKGLCVYSCDHRFLLCEPLTEDITFSAKFVLVK